MKILHVSTYAALRDKVRETLLLGQRQIEEAKVLTYWRTGQIMDQHIRDHTPEGKERAAYNTHVVEKLAGDLKISDTVLYRCVRFAQQFKKMAARPLSWAHYRALITVPDEKKRLMLADRASKGGWSSRDLEIEVRNLLWDERAEASDGKAPSLLPVPVLGPFYTYKVITPESIHSRATEPLLDVGFSGTKKLGQFQSARAVKGSADGTWDIGHKCTSKKFPAGTIVSSIKDAKGYYSLHAPRATNHVARGPGDVSLLYTYQAYVTRIVDGDTLKLEIDTGFDDQKHETIRLRGIDCPELNKDSATKKADPSLSGRTIQGGEGQAAKRFVERELGACESIILKSTQSQRKEKWGRYLGDIFYVNKAGQQIYLNNLLLEKGYAVRVRE